jgi:hypothetical protein
MHRPAPTIATPKKGGQLLPNMSSEQVGFYNYTLKQDWRRVLPDQEGVREGHDYFRPNFDSEIGNQPYPQNQPDQPAAPEPITLIHLARRPNGEACVIVGTPTKLYRYRAADEDDYYETFDNPTYFEEPALESNVIPDGVNYTAGAYTVTGIIAGYWYRFNPNDGSQLETTVGGVTTVRSGGIYFMAPVGATYLLRLPTAAGTPVDAQIQKIASGSQPPYMEWVDGSALARAGGIYTLPMTGPGITNGIIFTPKLPTVPTGAPLTFSVAHDGTLVGDSATCTGYAVKINVGTTTVRTMATAILTDATVGGIKSYWTVQGDAYYEDAEEGTTYFEREGLDVPYFTTETGSWKLIGSGFSPNGHRWEALNLNGYTVLNNGVDLPMTYRVEEDSVKPIYELRENGIAYAGTIAMLNDILLLGDVTLIDDDQFLVLLNHTSSGLTTAEQTGATFSGSITGTQTTGVEIEASAAIFDVGMVGSLIQFSNGWTGTIAAYTDTTHVDLIEDASALSGLDLTFYIIDPANSYTIEASANIFTEEMVGLQLYWGSGEYRTITEFVDTTHVKVDGYTSIVDGVFEIENPDSYTAYSDHRYLSRFQCRILWGNPSEPRRFAAVFTGAMEEFTPVLRLTSISRSFEVGMQIVVTGAGINGSNLTATIISRSPNGKTFILDTVAGVTVTESSVTALDAVGAIAAYDDLDEDSTAILRMMELAGVLVIYKDGSIYLGQYVGQAPTIFDFRRRCATLDTPFYRWTLVTSKDTNSHVYAGRNSFFKFDLARQAPQEVWIEQRNLFYDTASPADNELIFSADNQVTRELFFCQPQGTLCYDYLFGTFSTTTALYSAAQSIQKPLQGLLIESAEYWFVCGTKDGVVLQYGKTDIPQQQWGGRTAIYHRSGSAYSAVLQSGLFGDPRDQINLHSYEAGISSLSYPTSTQVNVQVYSYANPSEAGNLEMDETLTMPAAENFLPCLFIGNFFQDRLTVNVLETPVNLSMRIIETSPAGGRGIGRWKSK